MEDVKSCKADSHLDLRRYDEPSYLIFETPSKEKLKVL